MARIEFSAQYYGDDAARRVAMEAEVTDMKPLATSSATGDPVAQRVRATIADADLARLTGTGWTDVVVVDGPRTTRGKVSDIEAMDGGGIEFLLTPGD